MGTDLIPTAFTPIPNWFAVVMGIGTVFVGLIAIIIICKIIGAIFGASEKKKAESEKATPEIPNKQEIIAAAVAAIAEETGKDFKTIKVVSFKKL